MNRSRENQIREHGKLSMTFDEIRIATRRRVDLININKEIADTLRPFEGKNVTLTISVHITTTED